MKRWLSLLLLVALAALSAGAARADGDKPMMMANWIVASMDTPLAGYALGSDIPRCDVGRIVFADSLEGRPADAWDVSSAGDGSVWAWAAPFQYGLVELTIAGEGGVALNRDCFNLFGGYSELLQIDFGGHVDTSSVTNMSFMFFNCKNLKQIDLSGFDTSKVTDMSAMFAGCESLKTLDVSALDTSRVKNMNHMFRSCEYLKKLDLSGFDTRRVTSMSAMFWGCDGLKELDLSGLDTSKVTDMSSMFAFCEALKTLDLSALDTSDAKDMCEMFYGCKSLKELDLSGFDTSKVRNMDRMFAYCMALKQITLAQGFTDNLRKEPEDMFSNCKTRSLDDCQIIQNDAEGETAA